MFFSASISTPIGHMLIEATEEFITKIIFTDQPVAHKPNRLTDLAAAQLAQYFAGSRKSFELPLVYTLSAFQQNVLALVAEIPFGKTISYSELAHRYGNPKAIRAVAAANGKNPFAIVVPCHRIVGTNGKLTGYEWGLDKKEWLLRHENALDPRLF